LEPLTERFSDNPHKDEIAAFQRKMQDVDRQDKALKQAAADAPRSEAERFYRLGLTHIQNGDIAAARRVWQNLIQSFSGVPAEKRWVELAERGLGRLDEPPAGDRFASARAALADARKLRDEGKREAAEQIWHSLEALYRDDPTATLVLSELRKDRGN
jgi:tetratricopeptide (TPR) repeat protein